MQNNNIYKDLSRISKLRTSPFTDALSLYQEYYYNKTPCQYAYGTNPVTKLRVNLPTELTPSLALYCHIPLTNDSAAMPTIMTNDYAYMPTIYKLDNRRTDTPAN